jgi:ATP-binding protein involved in chromosome partitioning
MIDPRVSVIDRRLDAAGRIIAFAGGKGGVGKSVCAAVSALLLARSGKKVGLFDADFTGASAHLFLGTELHFPEEERGVVPVDAGFGLRFMSAAAYTGERGFSLRGRELTDVFLELFAITRWDDLDYLVLDMPPGLGDEVLDVIRYVKRLETVLVTTPSLVSARVVSRLAGLLKEARVPVRGLIENMVREGSASGSAYAKALEEMGTNIIASVPFAGDLESALGRPEALVGTRFAEALRPAVAALDGAV